MCFSFEVSLVTGVLSWCIGIAVILRCPSLRGDAVHLLVFSSMQFADAALWKSNFEENALNGTTTSVVVPSLLSAQLFLNAWRSRDTSWGLPLATASLVYSSTLFWRLRGRYSRAACGPLGSPVWGNTEISRRDLWTFVLLVTLPDWRWALGGIVFVEVVQRVFCGGYGSMWCALACVCAVALAARCA